MLMAKKYNSLWGTMGVIASGGFLLAALSLYPEVWFFFMLAGSGLFAGAAQVELWNTRFNKPSKPSNNPFVEGSQASDVAADGSRSSCWSSCSESSTLNWQQVSGAGLTIAGAITFAIFAPHLFAAYLAIRLTWSMTAALVSIAATSVGIGMFAVSTYHKSNALGDDGPGIGYRAT